MELKVPERSNFPSVASQKHLKSFLINVSLLKSTCSNATSNLSVKKTAFFGTIYLNRRATKREKELKWLLGDCNRCRPHSPQLSDDGAFI